MKEGITWLPMWLLYVLSDIVAVLLHRVVKYRRRIVRLNLAASFPEKSERELRKIEKQFYRNFCDCFVEAIKLLSVKDEWMKRHMVMTNPEVVDKYMDQGRTIVAYFSHTANWEWATAMTLWCRHRANKDSVFGEVYRPLRNKRIDTLFLKIRSRFGTHNYKKATVFRDMVKLSRGTLPSITGFMSDQKTSHGDPGYHTTFLNQHTEMISGTEQLARRLDAAVVYLDMQRVKRGHYTLTIVDMAPHAAQTAQGELTETYTRLLEKAINADPASWLWSHNRWRR